jgi:hypothetical protein
MAKPMNPHADFPVGATVRVRTMSPTTRPAKQRLAGRVGTVVRSSAGAILVTFPGEKYGEHFQPHHLDRVANPAG